MRTVLKRLLSTSAVFALSLQLAIPAGFMPASVSDGWYLKWCPEGMSEQAMMTLFGHDHHHSSHQHSSHQEGSTSNAEFSNCELSAFSSDFLQAPVLSFTFTPQNDIEPSAPSSEFSPIGPIRGFLARAPPFSTLT